MTPPSAAFPQLFPSRLFFRGQWVQAWLWLVLAAVAAISAVVGLFLVACVVASGPGEFSFGSIFGWISRRFWVGHLLPTMPSGMSETQDRLRTFMVCLAATGAIGLLSWLSLHAAVRCAWRGTVRLTDQLRERIHRHAIRVGSEGAVAEARISQGDRAFDALDRLDVLISRALVSGVFATSAAILACGLVLLQSPILAFECLVPLALGRLLWGQHARLQHARTARKQDHVAGSRQLLTEGVRQCRLILGRQLEDREREVFSQKLLSYGHARQPDRVMEAVGSLRPLAGIAALVVSVFFVGVHSLSPAADHFGLCQLLLLAACLVTAWKGIGSLLDVIEWQATTESDARILSSFLEIIPLVGQAAGAPFLQPVQKSIEFDRVCCRHEDRIVLEDLTLKIPAGSTTAIVSLDPLEVDTLVALLPRFLDPDSGRVLIDGQDLASVTLESARRQCLVISDREEDLLSASVAENLEAPARPVAPGKLHDAAKRAHAHGFIMKLPQGYETPIGSAGLALSPGQRFRLGIAVGFLVAPPVLVIREPEGAVSPDDKSLIDDAQRGLAATRTVFIVPRRHTTLRQVDRVVLINNGRIEAFGTHDALIQTSATYRHWEYVTFSRASVAAPKFSGKN